MVRFMVSTFGFLGVFALGTSSVHADGVFDVCKGESKMVVAGTGKPTIAVVYLNDFPVVTTPAAFQEFIRAEVARWSRVIRDARIQIE